MEFFFLYMYFTLVLNNATAKKTLFLHSPVLHSTRNKLLRVCQDENIKKINSHEKSLLQNSKK